MKVFNFTSGNAKSSLGFHLHFYRVAFCNLELSKCVEFTSHNSLSNMNTYLELNTYLETIKAGKVDCKAAFFGFEKKKSFSLVSLLPLKMDFAVLCG